MTSVLRRTALFAPLVALVALLAAGCSNNKLNPMAAQNMLPVVRLTAAPIDTNAVCAPDPARSCYSLTLDWVGYDADGRVDHFIYAIDPDGIADTTWITTTDQEKRLVFPAPSRSPNSDSLSILRGFHVFVIAAVDNRGSIGPRVNRAFFSFTKAPDVFIDNPRPLLSSVRTMPPSIRISWHGVDDDGVFTTKPKYYKYMLRSSTDGIQPDIGTIYASKGAAIRQYAPDFPDSIDVMSPSGETVKKKLWTRVGGDTTTVQFTNLKPDETYLFTVVGFDEAGAYSPVFLFDRNIIRFQVGFAATYGPKITVFNESFNYTFGASFNPANEVRIEVPADTPVTFNWGAQAPEGADIVAYRWMLDGDVFDERPRTDETTDLKHWSSPASNVTSVTLPAFTRAEDHYFFVSAEDNTGFQSLATVHFAVVVPTFNDPSLGRELLVIDDTRYEPDNILANGSQGNYGKTWPAAAELDTFMYAVGGVDWKNNPGKLTTPGILADYGTAGDPNAAANAANHPAEYDTLGTRKGIIDLSVSLATLGKYRHVIWLVDYNSAVSIAAGNSPNDPQTALRYMSTPGRLNVLGAYLRMGGQAWLLGGGGAISTCGPYDELSNNTGGIINYDSFNRPKIELGPARFMYDVPKWQSYIRVRKGITMGTTGNVFRTLGRFNRSPGAYAALPASFDKRTTATDPLPPRRINSQYYLTTWECEFIYKDNPVYESVVGDPLEFKLDSFEDPSADGVKARWVSSDNLNTVVDQGTVTPNPPSKAAGKSLKITTSGSGASVGDVVTRDFGDLRDWSGIISLKMAVKLNPGTIWNVRAIDDRNSSAVAVITGPIGVDLRNWTDIEVPWTSFQADPTSVSMPDFLRIKKLQFEVGGDTSPGASEFDNLEVLTAPEASVVDTLLAAQLVFSADPPINATMTLYHGHDFAKPFVFTGFAPWEFQRAQCKQLFDFVIQRLWGLSPHAIAPHSFRTADFAPAHRATSLPQVQSVARGSSGGVLRPLFPSGALKRRNGNP